MSLDGQAWLRVVRSEVAHGQLKSIDVETARRSHGVLDVLSAADLDTVPVIPGRPGLGPPSLAPYRQPVLAMDRVRYVGEPVAVVIAEDPYLAEDAADLVRVDIDPLVVATDISQHGSGTVWQGESGDTLFQLRGRCGDVEAAFERADVIVSAEMTVPRQTGLPLECRGLVAQWLDGGRCLHLWGPTKLIAFTRITLADLFGIDRDNVVCHPVDVGGMFGVRGEFYPEDFLVPWAARMVSRPVKWVEDRREHLVAINHAREQRHRIELAVSSKGKLLALRDNVSMDVGAYVRPVGNLLASLCLRTLPGPYGWAAVDLRCVGVATNKTPVGTMRGPAIAETTFAREHAIDLAAHRLGLDPVEMRMRNLLTHDNLPHRFNLGPDIGVLEYDGEDYAALFAQFLERADHRSVLDQIDTRRAAGEKVGVGVACFVEGTGSGVAESVTMQLTVEGRFRVAALAVEVGQGLTDMVAAAAARALGVDAAMVEVSVGDSATHDDGVGTFSSRSTIFLTGAVQDGARRILEIGAKHAAAILDVAAERLTATREGLEANGVLLHWKDLAPITVRGTFRQLAPTHGFGSHMAVASVNPSTWEPRVEQLIVGYDGGDIQDRPAAQGQLIGAAVQGLGGTLFETIQYDADGQPLTTSLIDYVIPTSHEIGVVSSHFLSPPDRSAGAVIRGVGEAGVAGVAGAVVNAVATAVDAPEGALTTLPLTPSVLAESNNRPKTREEPLAVEARAHPDAIPQPTRRHSGYRWLGAISVAGLAVVLWAARRARATRAP